MHWDSSGIVGRTKAHSSLFIGNSFLFFQLVEVKRLYCPKFGSDHFYVAMTQRLPNYHKDNDLCWSCRWKERNEKKKKTKINIEHNIIEIELDGLLPSIKSKTKKSKAKIRNYIRIPSYVTKWPKNIENIITFKKHQKSDNISVRTRIWLQWNERNNLYNIQPL